MDESALGPLLMKPGLKNTMDGSGFRLHASVLDSEVHKFIEIWLCPDCWILWYSRLFLAR